ncbi:hypothetical protein [Serratia fonticola]|uniref:hypothetical protein n=1 Tax=Serratia fonticola TaxID=47917 RepID=UPI002179F3DF|nr:hypothetical protein [Serratia fonticola]CAI0887528.1 Uncharacterised protein [Serratia fonticola]
MFDLERDFSFDELSLAFRKKKKALRFHLGVRQKYIVRTRLDEDTEIVVVVHGGKQVKNEDLARLLADEQGEKKWRRYLKVFSPSEWMAKRIRNDMYEAEQSWGRGKSVLECDPHHAVQLMLNAIALLDRGLKRCESAASKGNKELHKLNSAYGGRVKGERFNDIKAEVIKLLEARSEGWKTKKAAIDNVVEELRPYIEKHGWPSVDDKNDSRNARSIEESMRDSLNRWSNPDEDERVGAAFVKALRK